MPNNRLRRILSPFFQPVLAVTLALFVGSIAILITGNSPLEVYGIMLKGAFGSTYYLLTTLNRATPIIICGLGAAVCWSTNYMGIGGEGQMIMGGFVCVITALYMPGPAPVKLIAAVVAALLTGAAYSVFSAWLLEKFKMSLAISTLMLNYIAQYLTMHFVANRFQDLSGDTKLVQTPMIADALKLPRFLQEYSLHLGFLVAVFLVIAVWFMMNRTNFGYEAKMTGYNIHFCNYGGVHSRKIMYAILALSGAICALAGAGEVLGTQYRFVHGNYVSASFAWIGLNAALISNYNPIGIFITSIILAGVQTGGSAIARSTSVPLEISAIIQGCITLFISAKIAINFVRRKKTVPQKPEQPAEVGGATE